MSKPGGWTNNNKKYICKTNNYAHYSTLPISKKPTFTLLK